MRDGLYSGRMFDDLDGDPRVAWVDDVLRFGDTDAFGHINNSVFSVLCESGRVHLFTTRLNPALPAGVFFVIARLAIDFRAELHYPGAVRTATWPTKLGRSSLTLKQALFSNGRLGATAQSVCVLMDAATRRPTPLPEKARRIVEELLRAPSGLGS
jgi:acyl-CoA thioester hydrolase